MLKPASMRFAGTYTFKAKEGDGTLFRNNPSVAALFARTAENSQIFPLKNGVAVFANAETGDIVLQTKDRAEGETARQELIRDKGVLGLMAAFIESAREARRNEFIEETGESSGTSKKDKFKINLPEQNAINNLFLKLLANKDLEVSDDMRTFEYVGNYKAQQ